jgi:hypothetical protein
LKYAELGRSISFWGGVPSPSGIVLVCEVVSFETYFKVTTILIDGY